jgi:hypothetical protein
VLHYSETTVFKTVGDGPEAAANNDCPLITHNNTPLPNRSLLRESVAAPKQQPARSTDRVLHYSETTGGHAETAGGCGEQRLSAYHAQQHAASKPPAAARERSRA